MDSLGFSRFSHILQIPQRTAYRVRNLDHAEVGVIEGMYSPVLLPMPCPAVEAIATRHVKFLYISIFIYIHIYLYIEIILPSMQTKHLTWIQHSVHAGIFLSTSQQMRCMTSLESMVPFGKSDCEYFYRLLSKLSDGC